MEQILEVVHLRLPYQPSYPIRASSIHAPALHHQGNFSCSKVRLSSGRKRNNIQAAIHFGVCPQDSGPGIPIFIFLSPGVDVAADVEALGKRMGFTAANDKYSVVSLGQVRQACDW